MGSGKSSVARRLGPRLGRAVIDLDADIEHRAGRSIAEIFELEGEAAFRRVETAALAEALRSATSAVIATGGGVVVTEANRAALAESGAAVVWLRARPATLAARTGADQRRPLLGEDPQARLAELDVERAPLYADVAQMVVDVDDLDVDQAVAAVERALEQR